MTLLLKGVRLLIFRNYKNFQKEMMKNWKKNYAFYKIWLFSIYKTHILSLTLLNWPSDLRGHVAFFQIFVSVRLLKGVRLLTLRIFSEGDANSRVYGYLVGQSKVLILQGSFCNRFENLSTIFLKWMLILDNCFFQNWWYFFPKMSTQFMNVLDVY